ncbi:MAG TPA: caspase family protein [Methylibium sp.]|nr:caspase family protein [Methylibium sp.]
MALVHMVRFASRAGAVLCAAFALGALCFGSMSASAQQPAGAEPRLALVIGNAKYKSSPLANPVNDARLMEAALKEAGFQVIKAENAGLRDMRRLVRDFGDKLKASGGVGVFYFAGHGVQVRGENYLISTDSDIRNEDEVADDSINAQLVLEKMQSAGNRMNLVILDACRNNPFMVKSRSASSGLAQMSAPSGSLVAYSTAPGAVASDGAGSNGLYTQHLARAVRQQGLPVEEVFKQVRAAVRRDSNNQQTPWENTALEGQFFFKPAAVVPAAAAAPSKPAPTPTPSVGGTETAELAFWDSVKTSGSERELQAYLNRFPNGIFAELARSRMLALREVPKGVPPAQAQTGAPVLPAAAPVAPAPVAALAPSAPQQAAPEMSPAPTGAPFAAADRGAGRLTITDALSGKKQTIDIVPASRSAESVRYSSGDIVAFDGQVKAVQIGPYVATARSGSLWRLPLQAGASGVARAGFENVLETGNLRWRVVRADAETAELEVRLQLPGATYISSMERAGTWEARYRAGLPLPISSRLQSRLSSTGNSQPEHMTMLWTPAESSPTAPGAQAPAAQVPAAQVPATPAADDIGSIVVTDLLTKKESSTKVTVREQRADATVYSTGDVVGRDGTVLAFHLGNSMARATSGALWKLPLQAGASGQAEARFDVEGRDLSGEVIWRVVSRTAQGATVEAKMFMNGTPPFTGTWTAVYEDGILLATSYKLSLRRYFGIDSLSAKLLR